MNVVLPYFDHLSPLTAGLIFVLWFCLLVKFKSGNLDNHVGYVYFGVRTLQTFVEFNPARGILLRCHALKVMKPVNQTQLITELYVEHYRFLFRWGKFMNYNFFFLLVWCFYRHLCFFVFCFLCLIGCDFMPIIIF